MNDDYSRLSQAVLSNTNKIKKNNKEIEKLNSENGDFQKPLEANRRLTKQTLEFLKKISELPSPDTPNDIKIRKKQNEKIGTGFKEAKSAFELLDANASTSPPGRDFVAELSGQQAPLEKTSPSHQQPQQHQQQHQIQVQIERDDAIETDSLLAAREEENRELAQLEQDMTDLVDVFGEVNRLVHEQGEVIDTIEDNCNKAVEKVEQGNVELVQAADHKRAATKKKIWIGIILTIFIITLLFIIFFSIYSKVKD